MLRTALLTLLTLAIAIAAGGTSVWYALKAREGVGAVTIGNWTAFPDAGTPDADPYAKARIAREGILALGRAEGLAFTAQRDSTGGPLRRDCSYKIEGAVPSTRFWTLHAVDATGALVPSGTSRTPALHSLQLLRNADETVSLTVGPAPAPGNWLALSGDGPMSLVLTLYDTPIAASTGMSDIAMPQILRGACRA